jgi:hypothetical protein
MEAPKIAPRVPTGLAFAIGDLVLLHGWAEFHQLRMVVELDHCVDGNEYEEVAAIYAADCSLRRWNIWRESDGIVVQPRIGRGRRFDTVPEALDALISIADRS